MTVKQRRKEKAQVHLLVTLVSPSIPRLCPSHIHILAPRETQNSLKVEPSHLIKIVPDLAKS